MGEFLMCRGGVRSVGAVEIKWVRGGVECVGGEDLGEFAEEF